MPSATSAESHLDGLYALLETLREDSSQEEFDKFGAFFAEDATAYLRSMREHREPSIGRQAIIDDMKAILKDQFLATRRIVSSSFNERDMKLFTEMENTIHVHSDVLDPFHETAIVAFNNDGLINNFKVYSCRSHIVMLIQKHTGLGPYNEEEMKR
ncbi:hypothetical protein GQ53DRAFT_890092 [Thozetella sp. PMI_491]|nr:hypothetical protein GQ53DRAFT_890092 [Thozetella sp. PMI_491]